MLRPVTGVERYAGAVTARLPDGYQIRRPKKLAGGVAGHFWEQFKLPLNLGERAVLWSPANSGPVTVRNQVVSIHDVSPLENPAWFAPWFSFWYRLLLPRLARVVAFVVTDSAFTRDRIRHLLRINPSKIVVIPCGVDRDMFYPANPREVDSIRHKHKLPERYFLSVGSLAPRKNLGGLFVAWRRSALAEAGFCLAVAGTSGPALGALEWETHPSGVRLLGYVPDADLRVLYSGAVAYMIPSLYEGFGLPVLEAMACGAPVIATNCTALPEVVGEAGILVGPNNPDEMATSMLRLAQDDLLREDLEARGQQRADEFTWDRTSRGIYETLESVDGV